MLYSKYHKKKDSLVESLFFCKNMKIFVPVIIKNLCCKDWSRKLIYDTYGGMKRSIFCKKV